MLFLFLGERGIFAALWCGTRIFEAPFLEKGQINVEETISKPVSGNY